MSTNKTPNYDLHSWVPQDDFHMTEINENFTKLDTALKTEAQTAASGRSALQTALSGQISQLDTALQSEVTTRTQQMGTKANASTVTALSQQVSKKADASTVTTLSQQVSKKVEAVVGTYIGSNPDAQTIDLGRKPAAVHIEKENGFRTTAGSDSTYGGLFTADSGSAYGVTVTDTGFILGVNKGLNITAHKFFYTAFFL
ncbi:MAG: hypothetical protein J6J87_01975 [Oscillospiraceae bacterium]|nr:hypothetical protein [Oscillospiraceae bacterium]